jgi:hypothetical protein
MIEATHIKPEDIVNSGAFRAINVLLDQKAVELAQSMHGVRGRLDNIFSPVNFALSVNPEPSKSMTLPADPLALMSDIKLMLERLTSIHHELIDLKRFKLRLLNDPDFTHGDDTEQKMVFRAGFN